MNSGQFLTYWCNIGGAREQQWQGLMHARCCVLLLLTAVAGTNIAHAETSAGTRIDNIAELRLDADGAAGVIRSNPVSLIVAERLDVTLTRPGTGAVMITGAGNAIPVLLTNAGNG